MTENTTRKYPAIIFRQRDGSPLQVAFTAPSSQIDAWARVPTKRTGNIRNFQRAELERHSQEISRFFANVENSSPTAIVVGFDPLRAKGSVVALDEQGGPIKQDDLVGGGQVRGILQVTWSDAEDLANDEARVSYICKQLPAVRSFVVDELKEITGLTAASAQQIELFLIQQQLAGKSGPKNDEYGEEASSEVPDDLDPLLSGLSPSERQVVVGRLGFLASLSSEVLSLRTSSELTDLVRLVSDELKPGILIDGQHRVMGTKRLGEIPFLVTALPFANWSELAFQFIVTNRTAKRVPESLLISIVGNSLSKEQRAEIEERLREAGIRVGLIEAVMRVHEDEQSPFYGMLAFGLKNEEGFLDAAAVRGKVIQPWYERLGAVQVLFDHHCQGKKKQDRTEYWKSEELWFELFVAFWSGVRERYAGSAVFSTELQDPSKKIPASKLMTATVLMIFQDTVLGHLQRLFSSLEKAQNTPISASLPSGAHLTEVVRNTLKGLTPDFFTEWQLSGFDGSKGARDDLAEAINLVITGEKTVSQLKNPQKPHRLFKEV